MRNLICRVSALATTICGCWCGCSEPTNAPLAFYIVSEQKVEGSRFFSATNFPDLGYIGPKPDLIITNLLDVYPAKIANFSIMMDRKGSPTVVPKTNVFPALTLQLTAEDGENFTALTEKALDRRLLIMLGQKALAAPKIIIPIQTHGFSVDFTNALEMKRTEDDLKKLLHH